jgi:hypothetical protein
VLIFERFQAPDATAHKHSEAVPILFLEVETAIFHRHFRSRHRQLRVSVRSTNILRVPQEIFRVKIAHLSANAAIVLRGIEGVDGPNTASPILQIAPERVDIVTDGCDDAHSSDNDSAIVHKRSDR